MARSKKQKADQEYDSDTTIIDCHCAEVCDCRDVYRDVESSNSLDVSCSEFKLNSLKTDGATIDTFFYIHFHFASTHVCYVFNVNLTDSFDDRRSQCRLIE